MKKSLLLTLFLSLSGLILAATTYTLTLSHPVTVAGTELQSGVYSVRLDGDKAIFIDRHSKAQSVPAKVEDGAKKFDYTYVDYANRNGKEIVTAIHLAGSRLTLEFGE